jgi:hypothetical protein
VTHFVEDCHGENRQTATSDIDLLGVAFGGQQDNPTVKLGISLSVEIDPVLPKKMVDFWDHEIPMCYQSLIIFANSLE